ncbi:MAG: hypothetical protein HKN31_12015, partial [Pricia sp.]|nr:hypothetical protein [Pricia sp.]
MIYEVTSRQEWSAILDSMDDYDVYHTYDYHHLSLSPFEEAILMVYIENEIMVAIPIIVRPISRTKLFEAT